jgi:hypothetical protein
MEAPASVAKPMFREAGPMEGMADVEARSYWCATIRFVTFRASGESPTIGLHEAVMVEAR